MVVTMLSLSCIINDTFPLKLSAEKLLLQKSNIIKYGYLKKQQIDFLH